MGFLWCRRINSLCGEFYNKIKKETLLPASGVVDSFAVPAVVGGVVLAHFFMRAFFSVSKMVSDFYAALKLMFEFLPLLSSTRTLGIHKTSSLSHSLSLLALDSILRLKLSIGRTLPRRQHYPLIIYNIYF